MWQGSIPYLSAGMLCSSHSSLKVVPGSGLEAVPADNRPVSICAWLAGKKLKVGKFARAGIVGRLYLEPLEKTPKTPKTPKQE
ncbi:hypothetical protein CHLRE_06g256950v5 [Chlamydomonas reinhardtii]|uniref:Uncharacterized protein n=1 Tax=Chlamydomonas reinhardtii TaxID=3055 RepID=A0A2K3DMD9_CHLRE|nr:uncharacterized protein CHLRE_06g256950v5 [Chlamydomonas reinhardtii]PNW81707.1 hypothetical protein CHLRE_06g256950v5 [Chlamydomonas reinhardtii]